MQRQATEEERKAAWANYYAQQAAMLQQQPQQFSRPPPTFYQPPPTTPSVPVQSTNVTNHPQYQKYLLHYQQQILQQQQQWRRNNFQQALTATNAGVGPSAWNNNIDDNNTKNNTHIPPVHLQLAKAPPRPGVGVFRGTSSIAPQMGRGRGRGIQQHPAWMNNINNNDVLAKPIKNKKNNNNNINHINNVHNNNTDNNNNNTNPNVNTYNQASYRPARGIGRGRGRGRGVDINKPAWMMEKNNLSSAEQVTVVGRDASGNNKSNNDSAGSHYRSPADFAPPSQQLIHLAHS